MLPRASVFLYLFLLGTATLRASPVPADKPAYYPGWWFERDVIRRLDVNDTTPSWPGSYAPADDYAVANQGQLKTIASTAVRELEYFVPGSILGSEIGPLARRWQNQFPINQSRDDFAALNQGQLKAVAILFYDALEEMGYAGQPLSPGQRYPWSEITADDDSFATANLGQLKQVFSFDIKAALDSDSDGLPDLWETAHFLDIVSQSGEDDADADGLGNRVEFLLGTNPQEIPLSVSASTLALEIYSP